MVGASIKISGKVQGVFFRAGACAKAIEFGLTGWVANTSDGGVEIVAEGSENNLNSFIDWCGSGPSTAVVEKVEVSPRQVSGEFENFGIRY